MRTIFLQIRSNLCNNSQHDCIRILEKNYMQSPYALSDLHENTAPNRKAIKAEITRGSFIKIIILEKDKTGYTIKGFPLAKD